MLEDRHPCVKSGMLVPGVSVLGPAGVIFERVYNDQSVQARLLASATAAGRPHFNWKDMQALAGVQGEVFKTDARPPSLVSHAVPPLGGRAMIAVAALLVGFVLGNKLARV